MRKHAAVFAAGAAGYSCLEVLARGYTHWSMALLGGFCLLVLERISREFAASPLVIQALTGAVAITAAEFCTGLLVNFVLGWHVWDYNDETGNFLGQICPRYSFYWFALCYALLAAARGVKRARGRTKGGPSADGQVP